MEPITRIAAASAPHRAPNNRSGASGPVPDAVGRPQRLSPPRQLRGRPATRRAMRVRRPTPSGESGLVRVAKQRLEGSGLAAEEGPGSSRLPMPLICPFRVSASRGLWCGRFWGGPAGVRRGFDPGAEYVEGSDRAGVALQRGSDCVREHGSTDLPAARGQATTGSQSPPRLLRRQTAFDQFPCRHGTLQYYGSDTEPIIIQPGQPAIIPSG
jgi:hypothetical protein